VESRTSAWFAVRAAGFLVFLALAVVFAYGCGDGVRTALPGSYHDSQPSVYLTVGVLEGAMSIGFAIAALHVLSSVLTRGDPDFPEAGCLLSALLLPATALPYDGILDWDGAWAINGVLIAVTLTLAIGGLIHARRLGGRREDSLAAR
jgi:hypothetical protein